MTSITKTDPATPPASRSTNLEQGLGPGAGFPARAWRVVHRSGLLIPLAFIVLAALFAPIRYSGEFDVDEGVNLMKGLLLSRGHPLYSDIWSDQAPLATVAISQWLRWFGVSVAASRILVLLFSALLLWAFYQTIRLSLSEAAALAAVALLLLSAWYVRLSISVMIGLPALALAVISVYLLLLAQERRGLWLLIASGAFMAASLQTKLFTGILVPVVLVYLLFLAEGPGRRIPPLRQRIERSAAWLAVMLALFGLVGLVYGSLDPRQLIAPHLGTATRTAFVQGDNLAYIGTALLRQIATLPLAIVGLVWAFRKHKTVAFLPLGWLFMALAFLLYERPLWYHHALVLTIPLVWMAAFGIEAGLRAFRRSDRATTPASPRSAARWVLLPTAVLLAVLAVFDPLTGKPQLPEEIPGPVPEYGEGVADLLCPGAGSRSAGETWVFTDRPIYAFQAGLSVPPPMAVLSAKRLFSGTITENDLIDVMHTYQPKYVLLERYLPQYGKDFLAAVTKGYDLAREYSLGLEGLPGQLYLPRQPAAGTGAASGSSRSSARFGEWLSLAWNPAFADQTGGAQAGDCLQVRDLQWTRPEDYNAPDVALSVRLVDGRGEIWAQRDEQLGSDKNTPHDRATLPYFVNLLVPAGTPPGSYEAQIVVYDPASGQPLPVAPAEGAGSGGTAPAGGDRLVLGPVRIDPPAQEPALRRAQANFGAVRLVEADTPATRVSPGDAVPLSLLWQAAPGFQGQPLVVVVQLLDKDGNVVAGLEEQPLQGSYPSASWQSQELVRDRHALTVPEDTPPGQYDLIVGLYTLPDRTRLKTKGGFLGLAERDYFSIRPIQVGPPSP